MFENDVGLEALAADLEAGRVTSLSLVEECLARIEDRHGEGKRAFRHVARERALSAAMGMDRLRAAGAAPSRFAGIPVSIKDLFDIRGEVTAAGSRVLADRPVAARDAPAVARLRQSGFIVIGRTNMTEFAYSGLGLNPHYGTPLNPWERHNGRIPGGSSSGAAVSVTDGMAHAALGTDTGGSCRIPAALTGLVGFKPTARRMPCEGVLPLSPSLDSTGPLARSVACCAALDAVLASENPSPLHPARIAGLRLLVPGSLLEDMDDAVACVFERALSRLSAAGALLVEMPVAEFGDVLAINARGGFTAAESYAWHMEQKLLDGEDLYDPRVIRRILRGRELSAADYIALRQERGRLIGEFNTLLSQFDALAMPTVPAVAPRLADLADDDAFNKTNLLMLRNPSTINIIDGCAISLPMHAQGEAPAGLMLASHGGRDKTLLSMALAVERVLQA